MYDKDAVQIEIEVAFVAPGSQFLIALSLAAGATVADAIKASSLQVTFPQYCFERLATGIWGRRAARDQALQDGDRVEVYRALERDPMDARRLRASGSVPGRGESR